MIIQQIQTDIDLHDFDFTGKFLGTDTIASYTLTCSPAGLVEVSAQGVAVGQLQYVAIDAGLATVSIPYTVACQATSSSGKKHTLYKTITVVADLAGAVAVPSAMASRGVYSADLSQPLIGGAPTAVVIVAKLPLGNPVWSHYATGKVRGTLAGAFLAGKTRIVPTLVPGKVGNESKVAGERISDDVIEISVRDFGDNLVDGFSGLGVDIFTYE